MDKAIGVILGILIAAALYAFIAAMAGFDPYNFNQTTWVGETLLFLWHLLGALLGYRAADESY